MMRARLIARITLLMASAWFAAASASAQSTATIQGAVSDTQGAVMPGVTVTIHNTATGIERSVVTSSAGEYVAASLPPGHYALVAHLETPHMIAFRGVAGGLGVREVALQKYLIDFSNPFA